MNNVLLENTVSFVLFYNIARMKLEYFVIMDNGKIQIVIPCYVVMGNLFLRPAKL